MARRQNYLLTRTELWGSVVEGEMSTSCKWPSKLMRIVKLPRPTREEKLSTKPTRELSRKGTLRKTENISTNCTIRRQRRSIIPQTKRSKHLKTLQVIMTTGSRLRSRLVFETRADPNPVVQLTRCEIPFPIYRPISDNSRWITRIPSKNIFLQGAQLINMKWLWLMSLPSVLEQHF